MARAERSKPYGRPHVRGDPDGPGSWKHDLHQSSSSSSLADRLSGGSRPSLLSRISGGQGKELLPGGSSKGKELFGYGAQVPINSSNNPNAGVELIPAGSGGGVGAMRSTPTSRNTPRGFQAQPGQRSLVQSGFNAALGLDERSRRERRGQGQSRELLSGRDAGSRNGNAGGGVSILGAGKTTTLVRVANLAYGTTAEDVVSAFAPLPVQDARVSSLSSASLVSVDLELTSASDAQELINKYDGQIADGNKLSVTIVRPTQPQPQSLSQRMGAGAGRRNEPIPSSATRNEGRELLGQPGSGKLYSDTILQSRPDSYIQTLAEEQAEAERNRQRADAWGRNDRSRNGATHRGGSLAARLGQSCGSITPSKPPASTCDFSASHLQSTARCRPRPRPTPRPNDIAARVEEPVHEAHQLLQGQLPNDPDKALGHPIHPATVHWPIAFLTTTFGASGLTLLPAQYYPSALLPTQAAMPAIAHWSAAAAVITAVPAIVTGIGEGYELIRAQYLEKGSAAALWDASWNMKDDGGRKVKMTVKHASLNDAVVGLAAFNWYYGWKWPDAPLPKTAKILGLVAVPGLLYSAMLGGRLVYEYAVGVQRQGTGKAVKEAQESGSSQ